MIHCRSILAMWQENMHPTQPLNRPARDGGDEDAAAARVRAASLCYVLSKAIAVFCVADAGLEWQGRGHLVAVEAMFLMSVKLIVAHLAIA